MSLLDRIGLRESAGPELIRENAMLGTSLLNLQERISELELALEDVGWARLSFETGQEFYLLLATDKTDPNGFLEAGDFAGLLAGLAEGILHMDKTFKEKMAETEIELGSAENPIEPIKYDA